MNAVVTPAVRSRIVFVSSVYPHGAEYGAQQRVIHLLRILKGFADVSVVLLSDPPIDADSVSKTRSEFADTVAFQIDRAPLGNAWERVRFECDPKYVNTSFYRIGDVDREHLEKKMAASDLTWVYTIRTANECGIYKWPRSVLDFDDIPSQINASSARVEQGLARRLKSRRMAFIWRRRERCIADRFDLVTVCSEFDRRYVGGGKKVCVVPNGFLAPGSQPSRSPVSPPRLGFIGWFSGRPTVDGVTWFIKEVWPRVKSRLPEVRLRLVGGAAEQNFSDHGADVDQLGYISDPSREISTWSAMIVPLRIGSGTRVKIAQAFSRNCPVVSTSLGAYGYTVKDGEEILIADDAEEFSVACIRLINDPTLGARIAEKAWGKFLRQWTWSAVGEAVVNALAQLPHPGRSTLRRQP